MTNARVEGRCRPIAHGTVAKRRPLLAGETSLAWPFDRLPIRPAPEMPLAGIAARCGSP